jgi:hypothetical protein
VLCLCVLLTRLLASGGGRSGGGFLQTFEDRIKFI